MARLPDGSGTCVDCGAILYRHDVTYPSDRCKACDEILKMKEQLEQITAQVRGLIETKARLILTIEEAERKRDLPQHLHLAYFGSELACRYCNPNCHDKHGMGKTDWCGAQKCPMNPERFKK